MTISEIRTVLFVGAGTMGCANALVAAVSGYDVVLHDAIPEKLAAVPAHHDEIGEFLVLSGYCTADALSAGRKRVSFAVDLEAAIGDADLISESVFEDLGVKRAVHQELDRLAPERTLLTTNTSALLVSEIEDVVARGDRFAALHSHLGSLLFDIVGGPRTSSETIDVLRRYVESLSGAPLVLNKEHPGYVFNAINGPILGASLSLVAQNRATVEGVDRAWMRDRGAPMGPFGMMDLFGLDLVINSWRRPSDDPVREALRARIEPLLARYVADGHLGRKTGRGFYSYPDPAYETADFLDAAPIDDAASDLLTATLVCGAVPLVAEEVASRSDVDFAWSAATGQDAGPFAILDAMGVDSFLELVHAQVAIGMMQPETARLVSAQLHHLNRAAGNTHDEP